VITCVTPRIRNRVASVTMNDGNPVRTTRSPLKTPSRVVSAIDVRIAAQIGQPISVTSKPMMIPANPTSDPTERSNSPAIISSATAVATIPTWAATSR
jgi:hypothetical protein